MSPWGLLMKMSVSVAALAMSGVLAVQGSAVKAQSVSPAPSGAVSEIVVTGTRTTGLRAVDSPAPIQVLDAGSLARVGQPDLNQALAQNIPSFTAQAFGGDTANLTLSARLRGLSPNHTLVLVDGKRRHTTANLAVLSGAYQGGAAADLSFLPTAAIDHVEVLQEGAAAQYGTDAIAGVINIILKKSGRGGLLSATSGEYFDQGGATGQFSANAGFTPNDKSFLNLTFETKSHDHSNRGAVDPRLQNTAFNTTSSSRLSRYPQLANAEGFPYLNQISGDAKYRIYNLTYNAGYDLGGGLELYSFGSYGHRVASAYENYRVPNLIIGRNGAIPFPFGFSPKEGITENDYQATLGLRGETSGWNWDVSTSYGKDDDSIDVLDTANRSLYIDTSTATTNGFTPNRFHAGDFTTTQWTTTLDVTRDFNVNMAKPMTVAFGAEYREDTYEIGAGDPGSRYKEGSQSYPGFQLTDAGKHDRNNKAVYGNIVLTPVAAWTIDIAGRFESFSDFGETTVGKLTSRYDFTPAFAVRGTVSTGFRAPTLAEEFYSATNVSPISAFVQLPPNSAAARLVGVDGLKPEGSTTYSLGFVAHPMSRLVLTVDAYQIDLTDRIVGSGSVFGSGGAINVPAVTAAILANGNVLDPTVTQTGINIFTNGLDTQTRGVEAVATYSTNFGHLGRVDWSVSTNYNKTKITKVQPTPAQLAPAVLFTPTTFSNLETASPKFRLIFGALWNRGPLTVNLREAVYGESSSVASRTGATYYNTVIGTTAITDLDVSYKIGPVRVAVGANNLFNTYPDKINPLLIADYVQANSNAAVTQYPSFSPFGINGGYYYGRVTYSF